MAERPHRRLAKCHALFLGNSVPEESTAGLKALQQPLLKCYPVDHPTEVEGIDSWLTVFTSGMLLQLVGGKGPPTTPIWFPIQNLYVAAATKCINYVDGHGRRMETEFADINSQAAKASTHPPLFSMIVRKTSGTKVLQCYTFLLKDKAPAVAMVDAAKHAFLSKSGWANSHPPEEVIQTELMNMNYEAADDVDEFDSVSAVGGRRGTNAQRPSDPNSSPENPSQNINGSEIPSSANGNSRTFPAHLVKKYTLTFNKTRREERIRSPQRQPIPEAFMPRHQYAPQYPRAGKASHRSTHSRQGPPIPPEFAGSLRGTVTLREMHDPRTRTSVIERVIREPVPMPYPVYQPPQVIREVKPVFVPQPPQIKHIQVPVEKEVRVPVPIPVYAPYPEPQYAGPERYHHSHRSKKSHRHRPKYHPDIFKNYEIYDDRFLRREPDDEGVFVRNGQFFPPPTGYRLDEPPTGYYGDDRAGYYADGPVEMRDRRKSKHKNRRRSPSSESESDDSRIRYRDAWNNARSPPYTNGNVQITELEPDYDVEPDVRDVNGNERKAYDMYENERRLRDLHLKSHSPRPAGQAAGYVAGEFRWSQFESANDSREVPFKPEGARQASQQDNYNIVRTSDTNLDRSPSKQGKGKDKKDKKVSKKTVTEPRVTSFEAQVHEVPDSSDVIYKVPTGPPPRNWMDESKEYLNERAFSGALAQDAQKYRAEKFNAYALNQDSLNDTAIDRQMPSMSNDLPVDDNGIPIPPPLPPGLDSPTNDALW